MTLHKRKPDFAMCVEHRYAALYNEENFAIKEISENFCVILKEAAPEVSC